jgi:hypothetical protein
MVIRVKEKREDGTEIWYWLRFNNYGVEKTPYIYIQKDYKGIKVYTIKLWADGGFEVVDEYP